MHHIVGICFRYRNSITKLTVILQAHLKATQADAQPQFLKELAKRKFCIP
jgi:hypothetical protein